MRYCNTCILPDTRPGLKINSIDGKCNCSKSRKYQRLSAEQREKEFHLIVQKIKSKGKQWDCVIPVSGGKDSTWQTLKALEYGLRPLCVTWRTPGRTDIGTKNLNNLISLGVDHFDVTVSPSVEKTFTRKAFERVGIPALPMHMALFSIPTNIALKFDVPLIIWGENSAYEYGGNENDANSSLLTNSWLEKYGVTGGTHIEDWYDDDLSERDLSLYSYPQDEVLRKNDLNAIFLGYFFDWSPREAFAVASKHGFTASEKPLVGQYNFADIDEAFIMTVHHWLKWYKFGFTRDWDNLSIDIRVGKISREDAIKQIKRIGDNTPMEQIKMFCEYIDINLDDFWKISEKFRNKNIWARDHTDGKYKIVDFLISDFVWN